jgi:enamine deaminase RidA (YjgF/YER057c/UK114 family)
MSLEERLRSLGLDLPPAPKAMATYSTAVHHGDLLYISGTGPLRADGTYVTGRLGADMDVAQGQAAARLVALAMLATVRAHAGSELEHLRGVAWVAQMIRTSAWTGVAQPMR